MNKGLEALSKINSGAVAVHTPYEGWQDENIRIYYAEEFNIIENELKAYQELKEQYEILKKELSDLHESTLRTNFEDAKKLTALEIIKEKKVNVPSLITLFKSQTSYEDYEHLWDNDIRWQLTKNWDIQFSRKKLTEEEYNLLKERLS